MKIGVIADTHMPRRAKQFPEALIKGLQGVDMILHAGDWQTIEVYEALKRIAPVDGVAGNVDGEDIVRRFGRKKILTFGGFNVGITHGDGTRKTTEKRVREVFQDHNVDLIIFGHSHIPLHKKEKDLILFNPGSPTDKRRQPQYSFGIVTIDDDISVRHLYYEHKH
jgi:putative phosphoesterase